MDILVRPARRTDAVGMCGLLNPIIETGGTTAFRDPFTEDRMIADFIDRPLGIGCFVAEAGDGILGFQALEWSDPDWEGSNPLPADWAFIATYVAQGLQGQGVGRRLFQATLAAARAAKVVAIDAHIRRENLIGQAFYGSLGFVDYRSDEESVSKRFDVT